MGKLNKNAKSSHVKREKMIWHYCRNCKVGKVRTYESVISVVCSNCMARNATPPEDPYTYVPTGRPRGWHFKIYFEHEGKVYSRGKEVTDPKKIKLLQKKYANDEG